MWCLYVKVRMEMIVEVPIYSRLKWMRMRVRMRNDNNKTLRDDDDGLIYRGDAKRTSKTTSKCSFRWLGINWLWQ